MKKYVIIVAGGKGLRMGADLPKQFLPLAGKPVLMHTIEAFYRYDAAIQVLLVLPKAHMEFWQELCTQHHFDRPVQCVEGGSERFYSVKNGMQFVPENALVAVHDGVRPLVDVLTIEKAFSSALEHGSGIPVVPETDSLRQVIAGDNKAVDRSQYVRVQTPQVFASTLLKEAYDQPYSPFFTDDASVYESKGHRIYLTEGHVNNIKLTTPNDVQWATLLLQ